MSEPSKPSFWTRDSNILLGGFFVTIFLIVYIWWPLAEEYLAYVDWNGAWWRYMDWLLLGIFFFMSLTIVARANLRRDMLIVFVGICGGLAIESWGTQTNIWHYYTAERPPLWIMPAWPIASLSIDRITRALIFLTTKVTKEHEGKPFVSFVFILDIIGNSPQISQIVQIEVEIGENPRDLRIKLPIFVIPDKV
jgi:hypothetical protein